MKDVIGIKDHQLYRLDISYHMGLNSVQTIIKTSHKEYSKQNKCNKGTKESKEYIYNAEDIQGIKWLIDML